VKDYVPMLRSRVGGKLKRNTRRHRANEREWQALAEKERIALARRLKRYGRGASEEQVA
jgi:hypothetical protein